MEPFHIRRGFTLIELLVVLAIIITITAVVFTSQSTFNKTLVLTNAAYDVALTLRSAATFGIGSRGSDVSSNAGYGLHFESSMPDTFTLFADMSPGPNVSNCHGLPASGDVNAPDAKPGNCVYDGVGERVTEYVLGNGITISDFCAYTNKWSCAAQGPGQGQGNAYGNTILSLDIVFIRPNTDSFMSADGAYSKNFPVTKACLTLTSSQGGARFVSVGASGQIIANATSCP